MADMIRTPEALMAISEELAPSMNGAVAIRLAEALEMATLDQLAPEDEQWLSAAEQRARSTGKIEAWRVHLDELAHRGIRLVSVCDQDYPSNLRMIADRPPLLFMKGNLAAEDDRAIAVVGTRRPTTAGETQAYEIARELAARHVTVISGLAEGIDTAAHRGALDGGWRTIAVLGTGIQHVYPGSNRALAAEAARSGACVSQFLPDMRGTRWSFPVRNIVTSGLSIGTVVVEAGETSGARIQAQNALHHAKRLFLLRSLVTTQPWAAQMAERAGVVVVDNTDEVMAAIDAELSSGAGLL